MKILVIEDEPEMLRNIKQFLEDENYTVETAIDFYSGLEKIGSYDYDCILLDIMLPGGNGLNLLQELKKQNKTDSVIIISANNSIDDKIKGLELGADDYLTKPFHLAELNARIKSVIRRNKMDGKNLLQFENLKIDIDERLAFIDSQQVIFNRKELDILIFFMMNKNRIIRKSAIAENIWGDYIDQADDFDFIYSQIKNLRKKLREHQANLEIQAVYGMGYKLISK